MLDFYSLYFALLSLVILQSIVGVGILVIGTPFLLILNFEMIEILSILLPVSIVTSLFNLIIFKIKKKGKKFKIERKRKILFYILCIPSIFLGLLILKNYKDILNFKIFVAFVIFFSFLMTKIKFYYWKRQILIESFFLFLIGIVHGLTNSGGSILSLFFSNEQNKERSRYTITYFYLFIATVQYLIFLTIFKSLNFILNINVLIVIIFIGCLIANFLNNYLNYNMFKIIVVALSLLAATFLVMI